MEPNSLKWVGSPCGLHGPYIFYKAFRFHLEGKPRILSLGDFFLVRCKPEDPICIAELQLLWEERTTKQLLSSSKLYFLPEDTPQGRTVNHGEDEVIAVSEKVIVKLDDLVRWTIGDLSCWKCGRRAVPLKAIALRELGRNGQREALHKYRETTLNSGLNFKDVLKEKAELGEEAEKRVLVLSYPQYCRYRSVVARLRERPSSLLMDHVVLALGGITSLSSDTQILYCRDTFEHPTLIENESVCDEFAPNLKGRPRKKKVSVSQRRDSQGRDSQGPSTAKEGGPSEAKACAKVKGDSKAVVAKPKCSSSCKKASADERPKVGAGEECQADEQAFLVALYKYMKERKTPIERIPYLGFKQINLWTMFQAAQKLGGYEQITARRQWKNVYDELGSNPGSTSAATCTRRHYERLILPYERHTKGEEDKPLPPVKPRRQEAGAQEGASKPKATAAKPPRDEQSQKPKIEKDAPGKVPEPSLVPDDKEKASEAIDRHLEAQLLLKEDGKAGEEAGEEEEFQFTVKEEAKSCSAKEKSLFSAPAFEKGPSEGVLLPPEQSKLPGELGADPSPKAHVGFPANGPRPLDQRPGSLAADAADTPFNAENRAHVGTVLPTLKQKPLPAAALPEEELCLSYTAAAYPRGNSGIMSPLAKKKLLSQVSGAALPNTYCYGTPPPLVDRTRAGGRANDQAPPHAPQAPSADPGAMNRPSVIQHAQSFKTLSPGERRPVVEAAPRDPCGKLAQPRASPAREPYRARADCQEDSEKEQRQQEKEVEVEEEEEEVEKGVLCLPEQGAPGFLSDFYSSPHLRRLFRQTEHHLSKEQVTRSPYLPRDTLFPRDGENAQGKPPDSVGLGYCVHLGQREKLSPDEQPTDLSLPKPSPHKISPTKPSLCALPHSMLQRDAKTPPPFQVANSHPRACRVSPMTMSAPKNGTDPPPRAAGKAQSGRGEDLAGNKMEDVVRPILGAKGSPQTVGAAWPQKRSPEELENGPPEKKIRAVTPMHSAKDARAPDLEREAMKPGEPAHSVHVAGYAEGYKFPLHSPIFPGLYPGAFVSQVQDMCDSLGSHIPAGYSHPLQYLKNQAVISPLVPPFAIHSFMMQRQLLASAASPPHLYRHPVGATYGDLLHHSLYPMSALNPQPAFSPPQLSSVHPSTKLS